MSYRDHVGSDVANATSPALRRLVQYVVNPEALVLGREGVEVLLEQDILGRDVGEDEVDLGAVTRSAATDDGAHDLQHRGNSRAAGHHAEVADHVRGVDEGALGAPDADGLAHRQAGHVLADVAGGVGLDQQVEVAGLVVAADGGVGPHDLLAAAVGLGDVGADGDVLPDRQAEDRRRRGELEPVAVREENNDQL